MTLTLAQASADLVAELRRHPATSGHTPTTQEVTAVSNENDQTPAVGEEPKKDKAKKTAEPRSVVYRVYVEAGHLAEIFAKISNPAHDTVEHIAAASSSTLIHVGTASGSTRSAAVDDIVDNPVTPFAVSLAEWIDEGDNLVPYVAIAESAHGHEPVEMVIERRRRRGNAGD